MNFDHHSSKKRRLDTIEHHDFGPSRASAQVHWNSWSDSGQLQEDACSLMNLETPSVTVDPGDHTAQAAGSETNLEITAPFWCFGMVQGLKGTCKFPSIDQPQTHAIQLDGDGCFRGLNDSLPTGSISAESTCIVAALLDEPELILDASCRKNPTIASRKSRASQVNGAKTSTSSCLIDIILYGRSYLYEEVGSFFEYHEVHLQDPENCKHIVPYHNPHKLPTSDGRELWTSELGKGAIIPLFIDKEQQGADLLDELTSQQDLTEAEQPPSVRSKLQRHQLQALTFMLQREQGWAWDGTRADIWELCEDGTDPYFMNRVSNTAQTDEPPQFYGGIIADPMGLGKTLSMISLIASDALLSRHSESPTGVSAVSSSDQTLVVVPPPLLIEWERQLKEHVMPNCLPWDYHYGKRRLSSKELRSTLIVLTTYHTISTEWKNKDNRATSVLFTTQWKRVILDEAHFIRHAESLMAQSICDLKAVARWAVTGTPIQNKLADLSTLLRFLHVYPYSQRKVFEDDISNIWKLDGSDEAVRRLQRLAGCLILRRPKTTIDLPPRQDYQIPVKLSCSERQLYDEIRMQTVSQIEAAIQMRTTFNAITNYTNMLQRIEALRIICNLGLHYHSRKNILELYQPQADSGKGPWEQLAQRSFNTRRGIDIVRCRVCTYPADAMEKIGTEKHLFSRCWEFICSFCISSVQGARQCGSHTPSCDLAVVSTEVAVLSDMKHDPFGSLRDNATPRILPTKVSLLIQDLRAQHPETKCVVFSTWRTTLDLIETGLRDASIPFLRFDGKVPQRDRQSVVDRFRTDPAIKVIMLTLACGATGLTLTEATRAYLMEPNWNPTVEDQALARIHRIGQSKAVTTVRFIVHDSFEQRVVELQKTKRDLAAILLGRHSGESEGSNSSASQLELLRALV